jgi:hypothetical protein
LDEGEEARIERSNCATHEHGDLTPTGEEKINSRE